MSFKRKKKPQSGLSKFFTDTISTPGSTREPSPLPPSFSRGRNPHRTNPSDSTDAILPYLNAPADAGTGLADSKDASTLDWFVEGPGRRVGYDNLTAIDWIFEYAKERQRLKTLYSGATGWLLHFRQMVDSAQVWIVLVLTGICVGTVAGAIDIVSDWLGDVKTGICQPGRKSGRFYLSKEFCCLGYDSKSSQILGAT
jgi:chloride channel 3/4/5